MGERALNKALAWWAQETWPGLSAQSKGSPRRRAQKDPRSLSRSPERRYATRQGPVGASSERGGGPPDQDGGGEHGFLAVFRNCSSPVSVTLAGRAPSSASQRPALDSPASDTRGTVGNRKRPGPIADLLNPKLRWATEAVSSSQFPTHHDFSSQGLRRFMGQFYCTKHICMHRLIF